MELNILLQERRSTRAYSSDFNLSKDDIMELLNKARLAPSWKNTQTARCYVALSEEARQAVRTCLPEYNRNSTLNASAYIITSYVKDISGHTAGTADNELGNEWGAYDLGLFSSYLLLCAKNSGIDSLIMGLRNSTELRSIFSIPANEQIGPVIALGKQDGQPVFKPRCDCLDFSSIK